MPEIWRSHASAVLTIVFPAALGQLQMISFVPMFIYEVALGFWLLAKGARVPREGESYRLD